MSTPVVSWLLLLVVGVVALALAAVSLPLTLAGLASAPIRRRSWRPWARATGAALTGLLCGAALIVTALRWGRSPPALAALDLASLRIPRDRAPRTSPDPRWQVLAGDLHCHAFPWDPCHHAARDLDGTVRLAHAEGLDFIVVVPHLWAEHLAQPGLTQHYRALHRDLAAALAERSSPSLVLIPGFEYTDDLGGHAGLAFGDVDAALSAVERSGEPSDFFRSYAASGGLVTIHHPLLTPLPTRLPQPPNIAWRPFVEPATPVAHSIAVLDRLATQVEALNLGVAEFRDRYLLDDAEASVRGVFAQIDREVPRRHRRLTATGGTDSHGSHLRATMFVLAERRDAASIRDALVAGRTCARSAAGCSLEASADGRTFGPVGSAFEGVTALHLRARGERIELIRDGVVVARPARGETVRVAVPPGRCAVLRARVDAGWSGAVYANCGL